MYWYVVHTKPRQEQRALLNLEQQGYACYLPTLAVEKIRQGALTVEDEPLFPRYLFIQLDSNQSGKSWSPIRSTKGVSRLVTFGTEPAKVDPQLIDTLRQRPANLSPEPQRLFNPGERVIIAGGPFVGLEAVYQMTDGERRAMVLIELLSKPTRLTVLPAQLRRVV
jgi:transcriptional antiterminator RfaH